MVELAAFGAGAPVPPVPDVANDEPNRWPDGTLVPELPAALTSQSCAPGGPETIRAVSGRCSNMTRLPTVWMLAVLGMKEQGNRLAEGIPRRWDATRKRRQLARGGSAAKSEHRHKRVSVGHQ